MRTPPNAVTISAIVVIVIAAALAVFLSIPKPPAQMPAPSTPRITTTLSPVKPTPTLIATTIAQLAGTPLPGALVRVWNSMCVEGVPYTLLSVPLDAQFALVQAQAQVPMTSIPLTGGTAAPSVVPTYSTPAFVGGTAGPYPTATALAATNTPVVPVTGPNSSKGTLGILPTQNSCTQLGQLNGLQMVMCTGPEQSRFTIYVRQGNTAQLYQGMLWDCSLATATAVPSLLPTLSNTALPTSLPPTVVPTLPVPTIPPTLPPTSVPPTVPPPTVPAATGTP